MLWPAGDRYRKAKHRWEGEEEEEILEGPSAPFLQLLQRTSSQQAAAVEREEAFRSNVQEWRVNFLDSLMKKRQDVLWKCCARGKILNSICQTQS